MNLSKEVKEKIEIIDFPGLDTEKFEVAQKKAKDLLKIIDGFIYVNFQIQLDSNNNDILKLMYNTIKQRKNFSFNTCLFILNKIDLLEQNGDIDCDKFTQEVLKVFDEQNKNLSSFDVLEQSERIKDTTLTLTKFSCKTYEEYKNLENLLSKNKFEDFIILNSKEIKEKKWYEKLLNYILDEECIDTIKKNLQRNYLDIKSIKSFNPDQEQFNYFLNKLRILIKNNNDEDLEKIVKYYCYIVENKKDTKLYKNSYINDLYNNYKIVIEHTLKFFKKKQQIDTLNFMCKCFIEIIKIFNIVKLKMRNDNINKFKDSFNKDDIIYEINKEYKRLKYLIECEFEEKETSINYNINNCGNKEYEFRNLVEQNKIQINALRKKITINCEDFKVFLEEKNNKIIKNLDLKDLEEDKRKFEENMKKFENANMKNISGKSEDFIIRIKGWWLWLFIFGKKKGEYDYEKTKKNYIIQINSFFSEKENILNNIEFNRNNAINNINSIYTKFNQNINGLKNHFEDFKKKVKEIEDFIYIEFGIKD